MEDERFVLDGERFDDLRRAVAQHARWSQHTIDRIIAALEATDWEAFVTQQEARHVAHLEARRFVCFYVRRHVPVR